MAEGAEGGMEEVSGVRDIWQQLEEGMGSLYTSFKEFKKEMDSMFSELYLKMEMSEECAKEEVQEEEKQRADTPTAKQKDFKMAPAGEKERKKGRDTTQKILEVKDGRFKLQKKLVNSELNVKREGVPKRKRPPEEQTGTEGRNIARGSGKKKKIQGDFYEKKKRETKEAG